MKMNRGVLAAVRGVTRQQAKGEICLVPCISEPFGSSTLCGVASWCGCSTYASNSVHSNGLTGETSPTPWTAESRGHRWQGAKGTSMGARRKGVGMSENGREGEETEYENTGEAPTRRLYQVQDHAVVEPSYLENYGQLVLIQKEGRERGTRTLTHPPLNALKDTEHSPTARHCGLIQNQNAARKTKRWKETTHLTPSECGCFAEDKCDRPESADFWPVERVMAATVVTSGTKSQMRGIACKTTLAAIASLIFIFTFLVSELESQNTLERHERIVNGSRAKQNGRDIDEARGEHEEDFQRAQAEINGKLHPRSSPSRDRRHDVPHARPYPSPNFSREARVQSSAHISKLEMNRRVL
ncbi:hypothetical protein C8R45DRAFT_1157182 [Mycena sanguinolenta]|nr:hypothetical protein C8R45DRAFT_1157182 [Mycena sanguinolenta]